MESRAKTIIRTKALSKKFGDLLAVDSVSFNIRAGEIFGFLGPNGAGKTTVINMLTTLLDPTSGSARVAGFDLLNEKEKIRESIALISQEGSIDGSLNGWENLKFYGMLYHIDKDVLEERIRMALDSVKLYSRRNVQVKYYSGGMKRRLELAKVFITKPKVMFLDEPTLGLDPQAREAIWERIIELRAKEGVTVFLTTHYMEEAEALCDRVAIIDGGKLLVCDSPKSLVARLGRGDRVSLEVQSGAGGFSKVLERAGFFVESVEENRMRLRTESSNLTRITTLAQKNGLKVISLFSKRPTLEDVFLHYTGRTLRDGEGADNRQTKILQGFK